MAWRRSTGRRDTRLDRDVAVKLLRPEVVADADLAQRFRREALAATVLRHPNIVACLDTGTDGDQPYLVMDLVDGEDLAARLRRGGRLAPPAAARIALDVARALGVAHVRGIVHRDIKPGNILLAADGRAMVTDFGIARLAMDAEAAMPGTTLGSVQYFSPEQAQGRSTTPASDIYGLGLVLYETLTGQRTWAGATNDALALARVGAMAPSTRSIRPEVPAALDAIVARALAPDPEDRYANGVAMAAALEPVVARLGPGGLDTAADADGTARAVVTTGAIAWAAGATAAPAGPPAELPALAAPLVPGAGSPARAAARPAPRRAPGARPIVPQPVARRRAGRTVMVIGVGAMLVGLVLVVLPSAEPRIAAIDVTDPPTATARPTLGATPDPTVGASPADGATATDAPATEDPTATPGTRGHSDASDLCSTFFDLPCALGPDRYAPSQFQPPFALTLGDGWSTAAHGPNLVVLSRPEGLMSFLSGVETVDPEGDAKPARTRPKVFLESIITIEGLAASKPAKFRIDGRRGWSSDVSPIGGERLALMATDGATFYVEPGRTTRVVAMDVDRGVVVIVIEPGDDADLEGILETADVAAGTIAWD